MSTCSIVVFPASDVAASTRLFKTLLGVDPYVESPYYVGFRIGEFEIGLDPNGSKTGSGPIVYWDVEDAAATLQQLVSAGAEVAKEPTDVAQGLIVAVARDRDGSLIGLRQEPK